MSSIKSTDVLSGREASSKPFNEKGRTDQSPRQPELNRVIIPDLFVSFISQRPKLNPYYEVIKKESEAWMKQYETIHYRALSVKACSDSD